MYNLTELQEATTVSGIFTYANTNTSGMLMGFLMVSIFFIMLMILKRYSFEDAMLASSFSCFILSLILSYGGMLNFIYPLSFLLIAAFTGFYIYVSRRR